MCVDQPAVPDNSEERFPLLVSASHHPSFAEHVFPIEVCFFLYFRPGYDKIFRMFATPMAISLRTLCRACSRAPFASLDTQASSSGDNWLDGLRAEMEGMDMGRLD